MTCGIYKITNLKTGKFYIGSSVNIERRWYSHKSRLRRGIHSNEHLLNAWNKHGEDCFDFSILHETKKEQLLDLEQEIIDESGCLNRKIGYNKALKTCSPMLGKKHSEESKEKISKKMKGRKMSEKTKKKISQSLTGREISDEAKRKISEAKKGKAMPQSFNPPTPEGRKRISEYAKTRTGTKNPNSRLTQEQVEEIRKLFSENKNLSNSKVAKMYGVSLSTIKRVKYNISYKN